jgi:uncharacterized protein YycO
MGFPVTQAQAKTVGKYPTRPGTILVSTDPWFSSFGVGFGLGHSAIVLNGNYVVESLPKGVVKGNNDWANRYEGIFGVTVKSTTARQDAAAVAWARSKIGKPYNYNFYNMKTRAKFYCSQLVWAAFKDNFGINLNTRKYDLSKLSAIAPKEFMTTPKTSVIYKKG